MGCAWGCPARESPFGGDEGLAWGALRAALLVGGRVDDDLGPTSPFGYEASTPPVKSSTVREYDGF